jgi:Flp pilus assembly protein TadD
MKNKSHQPSEEQIRNVITLYSSGQIKSALNEVETLIQGYPNEAFLHNLNGICYSYLGKLNNAVASYKKALNLKPNYAEAFNNLGIAYQNLNQLDKAQKNYKKALVIKSNYAEAYNNLGNALQQLGRLEEAINNYEKAFAINTNYTTAFNNLVTALDALDKPNSAIKSYKKIINIKPDNADAHNNLGNALQKLGQLEEAINSYEKALAIKPDFPEAHNNRGFTRQELEQQGPLLKKWIGKSIERKKIEEFLKLVKPINTNHNLIRVGGETDGGYLIPNDIENIYACFSPGVSDNTNFENDLTRKGIKCFLADYSVEKPPINNAFFDFEKKYLGDKNDDIYITLESWVKSKAANHNEFILQMDIEGSEYPVIASTPIEILNKFRILVIEFHRLDSLFDIRKFNSIDLVFKKLLKNFDVVHIHPNNCNKPTEYEGIVIPPYMEFTFIRKDRVAKKNNQISFPHKLDRPNIASFNDYPLPKCWY